MNILIRWRELTASWLAFLGNCDQKIYRFAQNLFIHFLYCGTIRTLLNKIYVFLCVF